MKESLWFVLYVALFVGAIFAIGAGGAYWFSQVEATVYAPVPAAEKAETPEVILDPIVAPVKIRRVENMRDGEDAAVVVGFREDGRACVWPETRLGTGSSKLTKRGSSYHAVVSREDVERAQSGPQWREQPGLCSILVVVKGGVR